MNRSKKIVLTAVTIAFIGGSNLFAQAIPQQQFQQQSQTDVTDAEISKFANAYQEIQMENQKVQQEMVNLIQGEGFEVQRFNEIHESEMSPEINVQISSEEKAKYGKALEKIEEKQTEFQEKVETVIQDKGLSLDRYQEVAMALQNDEALQQKLRSQMGAGQ